MLLTEAASGINEAGRGSKQGANFETDAV